MFSPIQAVDNHSLTGECVTGLVKEKCKNYIVNSAMIVVSQEECLQKCNFINDQDENYRNAGIDTTSEIDETFTRSITYLPFPKTLTEEQFIVERRPHTTLINRNFDKKSLSPFEYSKSSRLFEETYKEWNIHPVDE